jgi:hypothetical protein
MISSLDEAVALLSKWKTDGTSIILFVSDGPPDDPESFFFSMTGSVEGVSSLWVELSRGTNRFRLRMNEPGTTFHYVESRDPRLQIDDADREDAEFLFEGVLSMNFDNGMFCAFNALRPGAGSDGGEE